MKKKTIYITIILSLLLGVIGYGVHLNQVKKELETKKELEHLYYRQNTALGLCCDYSKRNYYHDTKELNINMLAVGVSAYNNWVISNEQLTVNEIIDYLSSEFDSEGSPRIYSQSENIKDYIEWYFCGGKEKIHDYMNYFIGYICDNGYHSFNEMSYEEVAANLEGFQKDSEHNPFIKEG